MLIVGLYVFAGAVTTPLWYMAASRWSKKPVFVFSLVIQIFAAYTVGFCSGSGPVFVGLVVGAATVAGTAMVGQNSLKHSTIMDAVSLLKLQQSGANVEAIVFAVVDATGKLMSLSTSPWSLSTELATSPGKLVRAMPTLKSHSPNVVLFEENSILPLPECLESSGWQFLRVEVSQESL